MNDYKNNKDNLYDILQVKIDSSYETIKKSYKKLSLKYHPDKQIDSKLSIEEKNSKFIKIKDAYEILSNPEKRSNYDREISIKKFSSENLSMVIDDFKKIFSSKEYVILMNILDNKVKQSLLNSSQLDKLLIEINQMNLVDVLYTINNFKILDIEVVINFSLKQLYNNEYEKIKYIRLTRDIFEEIIYPIDSIQIYENEGENLNNLCGNLIVKININKMKHNNIDYQILNKDLYAIITKSLVVNNILTFIYLDDKIYKLDITKLDKNNTDFGILYYIDNMGLPYYDTNNNEIDIKNCKILRGKLNLLLLN